MKPRNGRPARRDLHKGTSGKTFAAISHVGIVFLKQNKSLLGSANKTHY